MTRAEQRILREARELEQDLIQQAEEHGLQVEQELIQQLRERGIQILPDLVKQARERGFQIGQGLVEQLWERGGQIGARMMLLRQLRILFGREVDGDPERRVASAALEQVERWADRILSAETLAEVFAD